MLSKITPEYSGKYGIPIKAADLHNSDFCQQNATNKKTNNDTTFFFGTNSI
jgi:hypothetical protein